MKRKYLLTTPASPDGVIYTFTPDGLADACEIVQANMPAAGRKAVIKNLHATEEDFLAWSKTIDCTVIQISTPVTFEMFWNKYNDKDRSSKKRSQKIWDKLKADDRLKAYYYYDEYVKKIPNGVAKKYAETYLAAEQWNN